MGGGRQRGRWQSGQERRRGRRGLLGVAAGAAGAAETVGRGQGEAGQGWLKRGLRAGAPWWKEEDVAEETGMQMQCGLASGKWAQQDPQTQ